MHPSLPSRRLFGIPTLMLALCSPATLAQTKYPGTSTAAAHSKYGTPEPMFGSMPLVAPVFLQTDQIDSSITVVNAITFGVNGTVTLRDQAGSIIGQQTMLFPSHSSTPIALKTLLAAAGSQAHSGSVTLEQDAAVKGPALLAQLSATLHTGSQAAFLEEEFGMPTSHGSNVLQGVASQTQNLPLVAITSVSETSQTIHASCIGGNTPAATIELPAYGTAVLQACSWQGIPDTALNLASTLQAGTTAAAADHAISLKTDSVPGAFYAFGFALNGSLAQAQLQPLDFYDPDILPSNGITYVGVPTGASSLLSSVLSAPVLTLANFTAQPRQASITWSDSASGTPQVRQIASLTLAPLSVQTTTLAAATGSGLLNTFTIKSNGQPGDIQAHLFTIAGTSGQRTELLAKDSLDDHNGGDHPWSTANGDTSTLLLYNSTSQPLPFHVRISGGGDTWVESYTLKPFETRAVSINDIVLKSQPDHTQHTLAPTLAAGEVQWNTEYGGTGLGRLLVTNNSKALARSFSCPAYYNLCRANFGPENFEDIALGGNSVDLSSISATFCTEYNPSSCSAATPVGNSNYYTFSTTWQNNSPSIVSQVSSSNTDIQFKGISVGQYSINGVAEGGSCQSSPMGGGGSVNSVVVNSANIDQATVSVTLQSVNSGVLSITISGVSNSPSYTFQYGSAAVGSGTYTVTIPRNGMSTGTYKNISTQWSLPDSPVSGSLAIPYPWIVLGTIRHSQYNTPYESACTGGAQTAYIYNRNTCAYSTVTLNSTFVSQAELNGTGASLNYGILKYDDGKCKASAPPGASSSNSFWQTSNITGQCGSSLAGGTSVAVYPGPQIVGSQFNCNDDMILVTTTNTIQFDKSIVDQCPLCNDGHVDNYSSVQACNGRAVGDLPGSPWFTIVN